MEMWICFNAIKISSWYLDTKGVRRGRMVVGFPNYLCLLPFQKRVVRIEIDTFDLRRLITHLVWFMVFNATFNNISAIPWRSALLVEETGVPGEIHRCLSGTLRLSGVRTRNDSLAVRRLKSQLILMSLGARKLKYKQDRQNRIG
jgi:hypothetical protein